MTYHLLMCALVLCGLEEAVLSQRRHCAKDHCLVLLQEPQDFLGARKRCEVGNGELLAVDMEQPQEALRSLLSGLNGTLWAKAPGFTDLTAREASSGLKTCPCMRTGGDLNMTSQPCQDKVDGFLCRYAYKSTCKAQAPGGGVRVKYMSPWGFELNDVEPITSGVIAVAEKVGSKYPESKRACVEGEWMSAPWLCDWMDGGCEYKCAAKTCVCPAGQPLHPNKISCTTGPCDHCSQGCERQGDSHVCTCNSGYQLAPDRKTCVDVDECKEQKSCTGEGRECVNTPGSFSCLCQYGFVEEAGVCVNNSICKDCEHLKCEKHDGVYRCLCREGFRVSPTNATRCEQHCTGRDCPSICIPNEDVNKVDMEQCRCPDGYIRDTRGNETICTDNNECEDRKLCDHTCENSFGGYTCSCDEGYTLHDGHQCLKNPDKGRGEEEEEGSGSGSIPERPTPANSIPAQVPSYVKTGSALGISVFILLCAVLLFCVVRQLMTRCAKLNISSIGHPDMDIFHLQQVSTETYKRLSFDKQFKNDIQRQ